MTTNDQNPLATTIKFAAARLMALADEVRPIGGCATDDEMLARRDLLVKLGETLDPMFAVIASEGAEHSNDIDRSYFETMVSDTLNDTCLIAGFELAAQTMQEHEADAAERPLRSYFQRREA